MLDWLWDMVVVQVPEKKNAPGATPEQIEDAKERFMRLLDVVGGEWKKESPRTIDKGPSR
ncbi:MAG TPA: hypothetical protein VE988_10700 [Gemmataceae bacterium]|nr:hypothetical protein [Gemmataceae bacterium]